MKLTDQFAANLRRARYEEGLTQEDLADRLQLSSRYVGSIERGAVSLRLDMVERIAKALRLSPCELLCNPRRPQ